MYYAVICIVRCAFLVIKVEIRCNIVSCEMHDVSRDLQYIILRYVDYASVEHGGQLDCRAIQGDD